MLQEMGAEFESLINARGRSRTHVAEGVALCVGAVLVSALLAAKAAPTDANLKRQIENRLLRHPPFEPPKKTFALVWPPLFLSLTLSGLRIWNAPASPARSRALGFWGAVQGLNALWMLWGPRRQAATLATAVATLGSAVAYMNNARKVDGPAAAMVSPYLGWISFAGLLTEELWRKNRGPAPTIH
jgi:benzodiazapine receptor